MMPLPAFALAAQDAVAPAARGATGARLLTAPADLFGPDAYPPEAIRNDEQGRVVAQLAIGADGAVGQCTIVTSSGSAALDATTCRQARTARFQPARDRRGRAVAIAYRLPVRWVLPQPVAWVFAPWSMAAHLMIDGEGRAQACTADFTGPAPRVDGDPCTFRSADAATLLTLRGGAGAAVRETVITVALLPGDGAGSTAPAGATAYGAMRVTIAPDGGVADCLALTATGVITALPPICGLKPGPFEPLPDGAARDPRTATVTITITNPGRPAG